MIRFTYLLPSGMKIHIAVKSREVFLNKFNELVSLAFQGKISNITFKGSE